MLTLSVRSAHGGKEQSHAPAASGAQDCPQQPHHSATRTARPQPQYLPHAVSDALLIQQAMAMLTQKPGRLPVETTGHGHAQTKNLDGCQF